MPDFLDDLTSFWKNKAGVAAADHKATEPEIETWEQRYQVVLPGDLRDYVTRVNGILGGENLEFDNEGLSFLPLSAMGPEEQWTESLGRSGMFIFADYLIQSYWWCAALDNNPHKCTRIYLGGGPQEANRLVANSLAEFFDLYKNDHSSLHFRAPKAGGQ